MKKIKLLLAVLLTAVFSGCMDHHDDPAGYTYGNPAVGEANTTIADLKTKYKSVAAADGVEEVTDDIMQWQIDQIESYIDRTYTEGNAPERKFDGFYFGSDTPDDGTEDAPAPEDLHKDTTVYINYTGKLLNGQVFDTTDERVAIDHDIYSSSKTYEPVEVTMSEDSTDIQMSGSSIIRGFALTVWKMKAMEKGTGIFYSPLGYGASGSGSVIPEYAPLIFEIEMVKDPDGDDE